MDAMRLWMAQYAFADNKKTKKDPRRDAVKKAADRIDGEIAKLQKQLDRTYELLEQGVYDLTVFQSRRCTIEAQLDEQREKRTECEKQMELLDAEYERHTTILPKMKLLLDSYDDLTAEEKNHMYKEILTKLTYRKDPKTREITIDLYPRL